MPAGLYCELSDAETVRNLHPLLNVDGIQGAVYVPKDCIADPALVLDVLAKLSKQAGVKYFENCRVEFVNTKGGRVESLETDIGTIKCEYFINCTGMWSRELGLRCKRPVRIPAYPAQHFFAVTAGLNLPEAKLLPRPATTTRTCTRDNSAAMMVGCSRKRPNPPSKTSKISRKTGRNTSRTARPTIGNHVGQGGGPDLPFQNSGAPTITNSPDNFTPDGRWIFGETAEVKNYYVACGMNGNPLQGSGGVGKALAEWIVNGTPTIEMLPFNIQRFLDLHNNRQYLQHRIREVVGRQYAILYPNQSVQICPPKMAYERALYFDSDYERGSPLPTMPPGSFYKPKFFKHMQKEYYACAHHVGIIDISSFSKIEIKPGVRSGDSDRNSVLEYLQKMCANDVDIEIGHIVHTGMLNERGGYENDCMLIRQSRDHYFMISPSSQQTRIYDWMSRNLFADASVKLNDVTSMYTVINVVGPKATQLMNELSNSNLKLQPFIYKKLNVGYASDVMIMTFTHTGMPGYCLYVPSEYALHVYNRLMTIGRDYGARDVGTLTQRYLRIDKFIPFWGDELTSLTTPFEAGVVYSISQLKKKASFIGRAALEQQKQQGLTKRLVLFHLEDIDVDKDVWPWGGEPLYRNGEYCGTVTSAGYGFASEKLVCLGYINRSTRDTSKIITNEYIMDKSAVYHIDIAGRLFRLTQHIHPKAALGQALAEREASKTYRPTVVKFKKQFET
ncbi:hypothetical protein pipiens_010367 [Culex pipiens pipiens]|uniref:Pyruvate dehydrogenase phosphatase regulatory subunit, mitochondrial n=1 Tax=Culex pipiens pipiens TaxID=38569 RepID=A0ABD1DB44_CULPP